MSLLQQVYAGFFAALFVLALGYLLTAVWKRFVSRIPTEQEPEPVKAPVVTEPPKAVWDGMTLVLSPEAYRLLQDIQLRSKRFREQFELLAEQMVETLGLDTSSESAEIAREVVYCGTSLDRAIATIKARANSVFEKGSCDD